MTVVGPVSKATYRFNAPGHRIMVDIRDRRSLAAVLHLVEVNSL